MQLYYSIGRLNKEINNKKSIVCHLRTDPLRKTQNCVDFYISLSTVIQVSIDSTSHNASMSLIQYLVSLQFGLKNFSKSKKHIRMGILVLKDHKCL